MEQSISYYTYSKDIEFTLNLPKISIKGDFELLSLVFQNFIFNAIDAIEDGELESGKIELSYEEDDKNNIFSITDNGKEIKNENILFEPFKTTKTKGNGLGLALSGQIIKAHGGKIELKNNPKMFQITLGKNLV